MSDNTCKIHGTHCIDWSCKSCRDFGADEYVRRGAEITRLRKAIEKKTHSETCDMVRYDSETLENAGWPLLKCTCGLEEWKRTALEAKP